jgi:hypothetical protein
VGLNDTSPLSEQDTSEKSIVTKVVIPGKYAEYRRRVKRTGSSKKSKSDNVQFQVVYLETFKFNLSRKKDGTNVIPPDDTDYDIVVQVPENEQRHPDAFARLPTIGPFKNWKKVAGTAIGLQWTNKNGEHVGVWVQADNVYDPVKDNNNYQPVGAWASYVKVEALIRALEQREISHAPWWFKHFPMFRIIEVKHDFLAQTWTEVEQYPSGVPSVYVESNWRKDAATIHAELVAVFGAAAINQASDKAAKSKGSTCGRCVIQKGGGDTNRPRSRSIPSECGWQIVNGTCSCETCRTWGTPCVKVDDAVLIASTIMQDALAPPVQKPVTLVKMTDARIMLSNDK